MAVTRLVRLAAPKNVDLQDQIQEVHQCVHLNQLHNEMIAKALGVTLPSAADIEAGVKEIKVRRRLGGLHPWQAFAGVGGAVTAAATIYKLLEPFIVAAARVLDHQIMTLTF